MVIFGKSKSINYFCIKYLENEGSIYQKDIG